MARLILALGLMLPLWSSRGDAQPAAPDTFDEVVAPASPTNPRNSEAAIVARRDGTLLLAWSDFYQKNGEDEGPARIVGKLSADGGRTWGAPYTLVENTGGCNVMEVNFLRLKGGRLALFYCQKNTAATDCRIEERVSADDGRTWGPPQQLSPAGKYTGLTNGRSLRLASGRILLEVYEGGDCYCVLSDDEGRTWRDSQRVRPAQSEAFEPACIELKDGRVLMLLRTEAGRQYRSLSRDGGQTWATPVPTALTGTPAPAALTRVPGTGDLLVIWNHNPGARRRNPLTTAISRDEGRSWSHLRNLEDQPGDAWAYPAVTWIGSRALITYFNYTGGLSLQLRSRPAAWFYAEPRPIAVASRLQLFVDDYLVERLSGRAELELHHPVPQEVVFEANEPWEGNALNYVTVFQDGPIYRMYYRGSHFSYLGGKDRASTRDVYCYAQSSDGIHWTKPDLELVASNGSKKNNVILDGIGTHAFAPFRDPNPACLPDAKYKALAWSGPKKGLYAFKSADGIHWVMMSPTPVITRGAFDSLNLAFWDAEKGEYREYHRDYLDPQAAADNVGYAAERGRDIRTGTSPDFVHWTAPEFLGYSALVDPGHGDRPVPADAPSGRVGELYTNQIRPYYRAPEILLGFPTRYTDRGWTISAKALPRYDYRLERAKESRREGTAVTDGMLMSSRNRSDFAIWPEAFIRPGLRLRDSWFYGDNYQNWGLIETPSALADGPPELSLFVTERTLQEKGGVLRRYTLRVDGFVSAHAPLVGGELLTKTLTFAGERLVLNAATSGAGSIRIELEDPEGRPIPGFALADADEFYGDDLARTYSWKGRSDLRPLAGRPVRLRIQLKDADLYSLRFAAAALATP